MTILDPSIEYKEVLMLLPQNNKNQEKSIPEGFHLEKDLKKVKEDWSLLMKELGFFSTAKEAKDYFEKMEQEDPAKLKRDFLFLYKDNELAATGGLWPGKQFEGKIKDRIHYIGVSPAFQNQHLASWLMDTLIFRHFLNTDEPLYLSTQPSSWPAILLYLKKGFFPYAGSYLNTSLEVSKANWDFTKAVLKEKAGVDISNKILYKVNV